MHKSQKAIATIIVLLYTALAHATTCNVSSVSPASPTYGQSVTITLSFNPTCSNCQTPGPPSGTITFYSNGSSIGSTSNSSGAPSTSLTVTSLAAGTDELSCSYSGGNGWASGGGGNFAVIVSKASSSTAVSSSASSSTVGQSVTFTATVSGSSGTPTGTVTFLNGSTSLGTGSLSGGHATFTTSSLAVGSYSISASYGGDSNFNSSSSSTITQTVNKANPSTSVTSSINPSVFGQSITFKATISGSGFTPTGSVTFYDGSTSLGSGTLSSGQATFSTAAESVGSHSITAHYSGDSNFNAITSSALTQTVNKATTSASVTSSLNPALPGQTVKFTASISVSSPGAGTPTGTVTFLDGSTSLGTGTLGGLQASFSTSTLSVGTHNITANYGGDSNFLNSSSAVLSQAVTGPAISSLSPTSGPVGTVVTISGANFGSTQGTSTVSFNGTAATPTSWSSTQIVVPVPGGASTGNVVVTVGGVASAGMLFTVVPAIAGNELTSFVASDGSLHTFYVGSNQHIYHLSWSSASSWQSQDVTATLSGSNLAAVGSPLTSFFKSDGTYHVAYLDGSSHINELVYASGTWSDQDATAASTATVTASANSQLTSFADAAGDHIYYLASTQHEYQLLWNGSSWANQDLTALSGTTVLAASGSVLSSFSLNDGSEHSFYIGANQHVYQMLYLSGKGYFNQDLTETAALDLADGPCAPQNGTCYASVTTTVGFGANGSYNFLTVTSNVACNTATFGDPAPGVTKACYYVNTPFPVAASGSELTSFNDGAGDHVYYLDSAGHNHQLTLEGDPGDITQPWVDEDQTEDASTSVVAIAGSALTSFATSDGREHLFYIDTNHHVDQMLYGVALWTNQDLTAASGASQTAAGNSGLTGFGNSGGYTTSVQYFDSTGHINQLSMCGSNTWQDLDLTAIVTGGGVAPTVSSLSSSSGAVGSTVTITGTNFGACQGGSTITFNGTLATPTNWSDTSITVPVPAGATTGNVVVTVNGLGSTGISFAVAPAIASLSPSSAIVGATVTINGTTFGSIQGSSIVTFNGTVAMPTSWSDTQIMVPVPNGATSGPIVVTVGGLSSNSLSFLVNLNISGLSVPVGAVGTPVTIIGGGFGLVQGTVTFNGTAATSITSWTPSAIVATVPTGATTGNVVVTAGGVASNGVPFTVVAMPSITSLSPTSGSPSTVVTITGSNFGATQGTSAVLFNGTPSAPTSWNPTTIVVPVPATASSGPVVVVVDSLQSNGITFIDVSAPIITTITPTSGTDGTSVTINGSLFGASQGSSTVTFNGVASVPTIWNANGTQIVVPAPSSVTTGPVVVTVNGIASNGITFVANPVVTGLSPTSGGIGTEVTIAGRNFGSTVPTVTFNGVAAAPLSWTASSIVVPVPSGATSGNVVVTVGGVSSNAQSFTVTSAPGISSISPTSANVGALVTIKGYGFGATQGANSMVTFSGISAVVKTWSANLIVAAVPQGGVGPVVVIVNQQPSNAVMLSLKSGAPTITSLSPSQGPPQMGFAIVITNIDPVVVGSLTVTVGDTVAPILSTQTSTDGNSFALIVQVPVGSPLGNVAVVVTTPGPLSQQTNALQFNVIPTFGCTLP